MLPLALLALSAPEYTYPRVEDMPHAQRNLFFEGAQMPLSSSFAEALMSGQLRDEMMKFQKRQRPIRQEWRGYEFGA